MSQFIEANKEAMIYDETKSAYVGSTKLNKITRISNELLMLLSNCFWFINSIVTLNEQKRALIVYIVGTPTDHIAKLIKLYPFLDFDIYDELPLGSKLAEAINSSKSKINFINRNPTIDELKQYDNEDNNVFLINEYTDKRIRIEPDYSNSSHEEMIRLKTEFHNAKEDIIREDAVKIIEMTTAVNAKASMVKFRPPHYYLSKQQKNFEFFNGTVIMPIFSDPKSGNCRMIVIDYVNKVKWDYIKFAGILNTWNYDTKEKLGLNPFTGDPNPLPNQLGNHFEICTLFSLIRDYYFVIGHPFSTENDVLNIYLAFILDGKCEVDENCDA